MALPSYLSGRWAKLVIVLFALAASFGVYRAVQISRYVDAGALRLQQGLQYRDGAPFSGTAVTRHADGSLATREHYSKGKRVGKSEEWYENGRRRSEREYDAQGERHARHVGWWPSGKLKFQMDFDHGLLQGHAYDWTAEGTLVRKLHYSKGHEEGEQLGWTADGEPLFNYVMREGRRYGVVNSTPCAVPDLAADDRLPYYENALFAPKWLKDLPKRTPTHQLAGFALLDQTGAALTEKALDGKITVVNFFFAGCSSTCPVSMQLLKSIKKKMGAQAPAFLSITVSPLSDDVKALSEYARRMELDGQWRLATGKPEVVYALSAKGFFSDLENGARAGSHTEKVFLIDGQRRIRGVYNATQISDLERMREDIQLLKNFARPVAGKS